MALSSQMALQISLLSVYRCFCATMWLLIAHIHACMRGLWNNASAARRQELPSGWSLQQEAVFFSTGSGSCRAFAPHWPVCSLGVGSQHIVPQEVVMAISWPLFISRLCVSLVWWTLAPEAVWAIFGGTAVMRHVGCQHVEKSTVKCLKSPFLLLQSRGDLITLIVFSFQQTLLI